MSFFEFKNSELSWIKNDFNNRDFNNRTDETLKIIVEKLNEIIINKNENETITDEFKNIIYKLNKIIIKPDDIIKEFKIDNPDYLIFGLHRIIEDLERIANIEQTNIIVNDLEKTVNIEPIIT